METMDKHFGREDPNAAEHEAAIEATRGLIGKIGVDGLSALIASARRSSDEGLLGVMIEDDDHSGAVLRVAATPEELSIAGELHTHRLPMVEVQQILAESATTDEAQA